MSFPNQSNVINGDVGASWFAGAAASISHKDFFKLKFNHKYVQGVAKYIQEHCSSNDKVNSISKIATAYLNICKEIGSTAHDRAIHFKLNEIFKHKNVDDRKKSEIMNACYQGASNSILSYDPRVGTKFSTVLLGNIENSIKSSFKLSTYDKKFDIIDFSDSENGDNSSEFFQLDNPSNLIMFQNPESIYENTSRYEFLKGLIERADLDILARAVLEKKYLGGSGAKDDEVSDGTIAKELSKNSAMVKLYGTKNKTTGTIQISRQKVNRAIGDAMEKLKKESDKLGGQSDV